MVPDKFNMVDMGGIDIIMMQGLEAPGLYSKLVESIALCRYQCLYNWMFNGVSIPPVYVQMAVDIETENVKINEGVEVDVDDVIHIYSLEIEPYLISLTASENGVYLPPAGADGFDQVTVDVSTLNLPEIIIEGPGYYVSGWYSSRRVNLIASGKFIPIGVASGTYTSGGFLTLHDYGGVSNVCTGDYLAKSTNNILFPDGVIRPVYCYGGMNGAGSGGIVSLYGSDNVSLGTLLRLDISTLNVVEGTYGVLSNYLKPYIFNKLLETL